MTQKHTHTHTMFRRTWSSVRFSILGHIICRKISNVGVNLNPRCNFIITSIEIRVRIKWIYFKVREYSRSEERKQNCNTVHLSIISFFLLHFCCIYLFIFLFLFILFYLFRQSFFVSFSLNFSLFVSLIISFAFILSSSLFTFAFFFALSFPS